jgi:hypothetical protein
MGRIYTQQSPSVVYIYTLIHTHIDPVKYVNIWVPIGTHPHVHTHTHIYICMNMYIGIYMYICMNCTVLWCSVV